MAKGKTLNPADAQRKAERKKELKKNKTERQKTRDFALVKKDTTNIEEEIERLEKAEIDGVISASQKVQLSTQRAELARINKKKEEYVAEHPEHKRLVYRGRYKKAEQAAEEEGGSKQKERKVFNKNGIPRHPERSVYYDPVMNPFGVPPPGMPYMERPLRPDEVDSQAEDDSDDDEDDDVLMPPGPPPAAQSTANPASEAEEDSDDDIPMPDGPPPSQLPPLPPLPPPPLLSFSNLHASPFPSNFLPPPPPPPLPSGFLPTQPSGFPSFPPNLNSFPNSIPPPPPGFPVQPHPPGFFPRPPELPSATSHSRLQSNGSMQDPLASVPHQTFQAYRAQKTHISHALPDKPGDDVTGNSTASPQSHSHPAPSTDAGIISVPAQLRDLKKESTAFVPSSLKRKGARGASNTSSSTSTSRINAAPQMNNGNQEGVILEAKNVRPDLLGALESNFPAPTSKSGLDDTVTKKRKLDPPDAKKSKDDYDKFMEEIGDILGS